MARRSMASRVYVAALLVLIVGAAIAFVRQVRDDASPAGPPATTLPAVTTRPAGTAPPPPTTQAGSAAPDVGTVDYVVDGDTVDIVIGGREERVRLIGLDAPEIAHPDAGEAAECYGPEAWAFVRELLPEGTQVRLVRDIVARDDYGRLLAYVYRVTDGEFVNLAIVAGGYAQPLTIRPNDAHHDEFVAAARAADAADLGLWATCAG